MTEPAAVAVFASGSGTNLQALLDRFGARGEPDASARVALLISDRQEIGALDRAARARVPGVVIPPGRYDDDPSGFADALLAVLQEHEIELIALAGYLQLVPASVVGAFRGRIVNIHPAPLPAFGGRGIYGQYAHRAVLDAGVRVSGPTIHFVDERYDTGPIIAQWPVPVRPDDTVETLAARVLRYEHRLYPAVVRGLARNEIVLREDGRVELRGTIVTEGQGFGLVSQEAALESAERAWKIE